MPQPRKVPDNALAALRSGAPASDIANLLGVDVGTVYRYKTAAKAAGLIEGVVPVSDAALIACYIDGEAIPAIARRLGIGRSTAYARIERLVADGIIAKREVALRTPPAPEIVSSQPEAFERIVELRQAGKTTREIVALTGLGEGFVLSQIRAAIAAGVVPRARGRNIDREAAVITLRRLGKSRREICVELGLSKHTVDSVIAAAIEQGRTKPLPTERLRPQLVGQTTVPSRRPGRTKPAKARVKAYIGSHGIDAAQDRWPDFTIAELQALAPKPPQRTAEEAVAIVEEFLAKPAAATPNLPDGYTPAEGDMLLVIERPASVEVKPRAAPALNSPYVAEVYNRHGLDEVRRRWPEASDDALDAAIRVGRRMVAPPTDDLPKGWSTRIAGAIARLFGRS